VGADGAVLEWGEPRPEAEPAHRPQSPLIGAYPYALITRRTPALFAAVEAALDKRRRAGGCNTGWSRAWAGGLYARMGRGDDARDMVGGMARLSGQPNLFSCCNIGRVPKLMEDAMPMQLDGNLGAVQAVVEMLLASHGGEIRLLPALPASWWDGEFRVAGGPRKRGD
jgi:alpha-L-fucosidase 2